MGTAGRGKGKLRRALAWAGCAALVCGAFVGGFYWGREKPVESSGKCRVLYYRLDLPNAGMFTWSLQVVELDLEAGRMRRLDIGSNTPEHRIPEKEAEIAGLLSARPWSRLSDSRMAEYHRALYAWLATRPPPAYNAARDLGIEDSYAEKLILYAGRRSCSTRVNPRGGHSELEPLNPPKEWGELTALLWGLRLRPRNTE